MKKEVARREIESLDYYLQNHTDDYSEESHTAMMMAISALSENKGEWIEVVTEKFPNGEKRMWHYECSSCSMGEPPCPINKEHWDFCPNCGADMRPEPYKAESEVKPNETDN